MVKIVDSNLYDYEYYMSNNAGYHEFKEGIEKDKGNLKFQNVLKFCSFSPEKTILDVGCGRGELVYYAAKAGCKKAIGIDYSSAAIKIAESFAAGLDKEIKERMLFFNIDASQMPNNEKFDYIFMVEVWEHMYDHQLSPLLSEIRKLLKDDGCFILTTPNGFYEMYLYSAKRIINIPFNFVKFPLRILQKKWKPKSFYDLLRHIFKIKSFKNTFMDKTHVNISTPKKIKKMLEAAGYGSKIKCWDNSKNPLSLLLSHWAGREMIIVAKKQ